jgi:formate hydrogenlyase subunit 6/NADH:ubiquinone oxidoreductase subunit I
MQQLDLFAPIREMLSSPEKWTQRAYARNDDGQVVSMFDRDATRRCLVGALCTVYCPVDAVGVNELCTVELQRRLQLTLDYLDTIPLSDFNDDPNTVFADIQCLLAEPFYGPSDAAP